MKKIASATTTIMATLVAISLAFALACVPITRLVNADEPPLNIMVVGDSISVGCDDAPLGGWCTMFSTLLTQNGINHTIAGHVISGYSCSGLSTGFPARFNEINPDVVIMNCGTNDAPNDTAAMNYMGEKWRTMVEYSWTHGALILPVFIQYSNREINDEVGRGWLVPGEGHANDVIYVNMQYYISAGWFVGLADLQQIPGDWNYLAGGTDGIHPNDMGKNVMATIMYRAMRGHYGWPNTVQKPCGMWGHRIEYGPPAYTACTEMN
jgi:lysophospholipase L1-like esterase